MAHTPGPWAVAPAMEGPNQLGQFDVVSGDLFVAGTVGGLPEGVEAANAHLLAAAPDLLAALKDLLDNPAYQLAVGYSPHAMHSLLVRGRAAIAKAEGW